MIAGSSSQESTIILQTIEAANDALSRNAAEASQLIQKHATGVSSFQSTIASTSHDLVGGTGNENFQLIVQNLTQACTTIQERNALVELQLAEMRKNFDELQKSLDQVRKEAATDPLTGLMNRRGFDRAISECLSSATQTGEPLCLAVCDIDHFKAFNDQHGHLVGDQVIKFIAKTLKDSLRDGDIASRFGGEEFAVLLPKTSVEEAGILAERIRIGVSAKRMVKRATKEPLGQVTISIGISRFDRQQNPEDLFEAADQNLYAAKVSGRNRIVMSQ